MIVSASFLLCFLLLVYFSKHDIYAIVLAATAGISFCLVEGFFLFTPNTGGFEYILGGNAILHLSSAVLLYLVLRKECPVILISASCLLAVVYYQAMISDAFYELHFTKGINVLNVILLLSMLHRMTHEHIRTLCSPLLQRLSVLARSKAHSQK